LFNKTRSVFSFLTLTVEPKIQLTKVLSVKSSVLCCARVTYFILMPKSRNLKQFIVEFGDDIFSTDDILYCKIHDTKVAEQKRITVQQCISHEEYTCSVNFKQKEIYVNVTATVFI
jgi:hypothetical protein